MSCEAPLSMGFSRQEYSSGLPCPPPEDLPDPGIEPRSLESPALAGGRQVLYHGATVGLQEVTFHESLVQGFLFSFHFVIMLVVPYFSAFCTHSVAIH